MTARPPRGSGKLRIRRDNGRALYPFAPRTPVLVVPGLNDSGPEHWQTLWQAKHPSFRRVVQEDFATPALERWSETIAHAVERAQLPESGPVHLNAPFRDPLAPVADDGTAAKMQAQLGEMFFCLRKARRQILGRVNRSERTL